MNIANSYEDKWEFINKKFGEYLISNDDIKSSDGMMYTLNETGITDAIYFILYTNQEDIQFDPELMLRDDSNHQSEEYLSEQRSVQRSLLKLYIRNLVNMKESKEAIEYIDKLITTILERRYYICLSTPLILYLTEYNRAKEIYTLITKSDLESLR